MPGRGGCCVTPRRRLSEKSVDGWGMSIEVEAREEINGEAGHVELAAGDIEVFVTHVGETVSVVAVDDEWQGSVVVEGDRREVREV